MDLNKYTECNIYYAHHMSSKIGAIVTTIMSSALLVLFIVGRSTLDYSALHIPEKEDLRVLSIKIHTITEEQLEIAVQDVTVQKKRVLQKKVQPVQEKKERAHEHVVTATSKASIVTHDKEHMANANVLDTDSIPEKEEMQSTAQESVASHPVVEKNSATEIEKAVASILQAIEKKKTYPRIARRAGYEGTVHIQVTLNTEGVITQCTLYKTSGYALLDNVTLDMVKKML